MKPKPDIYTHATLGEFNYIHGLEKKENMKNCKCVAPEAQTYHLQVIGVQHICAGN